MRNAALELCEVVAQPADLVDCMACYLAVQAGNRTDPANAPSFPAYRAQAAATLATLDQTVPGFAARSAHIRCMIAAAREELTRFVPRSQW